VPINFGDSFDADSIPKTAIVRLNSLVNLEEDEDCSETGDLEACCKLVNIYFPLPRYSIILEVVMGWRYDTNFMVMVY
jgi:hypothetical protein